MPYVNNHSDVKHFEGKKMKKWLKMGIELEKKLIKLKRNKNGLFGIKIDISNQRLWTFKLNFSVYLTIWNISYASFYSNWTENFN